MASTELDPGFEEKILEEAIRSPSIAMMRLSIEIDRQLRLILAVIGRLKDYTGLSPNEALDLMETCMEGSLIPSELRDTVKNFWELRNYVVHSGGSQVGYAMRAVDYVNRILRMLQTIPRPWKAHPSKSQRLRSRSERQLGVEHGGAGLGRDVVSEPINRGKYARLDQFA